MRFMYKFNLNGNITQANKFAVLFGEKKIADEKMNSVITPNVQVHFL